MLLIKQKPAFKWQRYPLVVSIAWLNEEIPCLNAELNHLLLTLTLLSHG